MTQQLHTQRTKSTWVSAKTWHMDIHGNIIYPLEDNHFAACTEIRVKDEFC